MIYRRIRTQQSHFQKMFLKVWARSCSVAFLVLLAVKWVVSGHP